MLIKKAEFITSIASIDKYAEVSNGYNCHELCVVGRSNVGKSSFINCLAGQSKLAKTSSTPGRTRLINIFGINDLQFVLVDLPGYGYAAAAKSEKRKWGELIEGYLEKSEKLRHVFCLVDIRHDPSVLDKQMLMYLYHFGLSFTVIATKCDKLSHAQINNRVMALSTGLSVGRDNIIPVSAITAYGKDRALKRLAEVFESTPNSFNGDNKDIYENNEET